MKKEHREYRRGVEEDIVELIRHHLPGRSRDTEVLFKGWLHGDYLEIQEDGTVDALLSYFAIDFPFDIVVTMQRNDKFSKSHIKLLIDVIKNRVKPIMIASNAHYNKVLERAVVKYGGEWVGDEIWFR